MRQSDTPLPKPPGGDRPSENWVCGNAKYGTPCPCGPLPGGKCPAQGLCVPSSGNAAGQLGATESSYQCTRPKCLGGPCEMGPEPDGMCGMIPKPCVPVRSSLGRRRLMIRLATAVGVGLLLLALGGTWRREIFAPGQLIEPHALLLGGEQRNDRCAACHPAARGQFAQWFGSGKAGHANVKQSDLCMDCHHAKLDRKLATMPHNLSQDELREVLKSLQQPTQRVKSVSFNISGVVGEIECSVCHREHHGKDADLTAMSNQQCQACHSIRFESFAIGHPQWEQWPYGRGGSIAFNHSSHQINHFPKDGAAFDCRSCHSVNVQGEIARAASFEIMCASCHQKPLELVVSEGFTLVGLPTLDNEAVEQANLSLGPWPNAARGVDRIELPEFTRALLSTDDKAAKAIEQLTNPKLTHMALPLSEASIQATVQTAEALRQLLAGLATDPSKEMRTRLGTDNAAEALGQLSPQQTAAAWHAWFGSAEDSQTSKSVDAQQMLPNGGWYRDDLRSAIRYRGMGHADPLLKTLAELTTNQRLSESQRVQIASIAAVQACLECHPKPNSELATSWKSLRSDADKRLFTKFSHRPHMNLPQLVDCTYCHQVNQPATLVSNPATGMDTPGMLNDFRQMHKTACLDCHVPNAAGDSCTKCHNYHVDPLR